MTNSTQKSAFFAIGLLLFALFFGSGNLIYPASLGQQAGENLFTAMSGFLLSGVGLPLLGIIAIGYSNSKDIQELAGRVAPWYGVFFSVALYLAISPLFVAPRTATVAFELAVVPFLGDETSKTLTTFIFCLIFFLITYWLVFEPSKMVDRIGKVLTPALLLTILLLVSAAVFFPMGTLQPAQEAFATSSTAFAKGFLEGYGTMDALASLAFAITVIDAVRNRGIHENRQILSLTARSGIVAVSFLAIVYVGIAYLGATSVEILGMQENGTAVLSKNANYYFGSSGQILLAFIALLACLTTAVGLISACSGYFNRLVPTISYKKWAVVFTVISFTLANFGLSSIIKFSVPLLMFLYPLTIVIILLALLHKVFDNQRAVYASTMFFTGFIAIIDGWKQAHAMFEGSPDALIMQVDGMLKSHLPLYDLGLGWIIPAVIGFAVGLVLTKLKK